MRLGSVVECVEEGFSKAGAVAGPGRGGAAVRDASCWTDDVFCAGVSEGPVHGRNMSTRRRNACYL